MIAKLRNDANDTHRGWFQSRNLFTRRRLRRDRSQARVGRLVEQLENRILLAADVFTDKPDYSPGETAIISASGYEIGETVEFQVLHLDGNNSGDGHDPWQVTDGGAGDLDGLADGNIQTTWYVNPDDSLGADFELTAAGLSSGLFASHFFTDKPAINLDQCANGAVGDLPAVTQCTGAAWQNGNLNANQSHYFEGDSVPYRSLITGLTDGEIYTVTIGWDTSHSSGKHTIDYITSFDRTETDADPCDDLANVNCTGVSDTAIIPIDPKVLAGPDGLTGSAINDADNITQIPGEIALFGGASFFGDDPTSYTYTGDFTGASTAAITVSFEYQGTPDSNGTVVLAWSGHIGTRANWGEDNSAVFINGSPYHMRVEDFACSEVTNCGVGSQDRSLNADAIIAPGIINIVKVAQPNDEQDFEFSVTDDQGAPVNDTAGDPVTNFLLDDDADVTLSDTESIEFIPGLYNITELGIDGWTLQSIVSDQPNANPQDLDDAPNEGAILVNLLEGETVTLTFTNSIDFIPDPQYSITKTVTDVGTDGAGGSVDAADDVISYDIVVSNDGNIDLTNVAVTDPLLGGDIGSPDSGDGGVAGVLDVGETWTWNVTYTATQADINNNGGGDGDIDNTATVSSTELDDESASAAVPIVQNPGIAVAKLADVTTVDAANAVITYSYEVTNTGNVTLTNITLGDDNTDAAPTYVSGDTDVDGKLDLTETWIYSAIHTVTQDEIDNGANIDNIGTANSTEAGPATDDESVDVVQNPAYTIDKTITDVDGGGPDGVVDAVGDIISYSIVVTNTGNITITGVSLTDTLVANVGDPVESISDNNDLDVGETWTWTYTYTVVADDLDNDVIFDDDSDGSINNTAEVCSAELDKMQDSESVPVDVLPAIDVVKTASKNVVPVGGANVTYTYDVTNTSPAGAGDPLTVTDLVDDNGTPGDTGDDIVLVVGGVLQAGVTLDKTGGDADDLLEVGETWTYTITLFIDGDLLSDHTNVVVVTGVDDEGDIATDDDDETVIIGSGVVTDSSLTRFDRDPDTEGDQFNLIFTPGSGGYKLNGSNPGQFFYNVFYDGLEDNPPVAGDIIQVSLSIPYPFVTKGGMPIHIYDSATIQDNGGFSQIVPGDIAESLKVPDDDGAITLDDYELNPVVGVTTYEFTVDVTLPEITEFFYLNIHLDYGLKGPRVDADGDDTPDRYGRDSDDNALDSNGIVIGQHTEHTFGHTVDITNDEIDDPIIVFDTSVENSNIFKKMRGFGGLVSSSGVGVAGATVEIQDDDGNTVETTTSDEDGWYFSSYVHKGKPSTYNVVLQGLNEFVRVKSNQFANVDFDLTPPPLAAFEAPATESSAISAAIDEIFADDTTENTDEASSDSISSVAIDSVVIEDDPTIELISTEEDANTEASDRVFELLESIQTSAENRRASRIRNLVHGGLMNRYRHR